MAIGLAAMLIVQSAVTYDCTLEPPHSLGEQDGQPRLNPIQIPEPRNMRFQIIVREEGDDFGVVVRWDGNPMQIAGRFPALRTGEGALAFTAFSAGPCLFTERMCMSLVQLADEDAHRARILVTPSALWTDRERNTRRPFLAVLSGTCNRSETSR